MSIKKGIHRKVLFYFDIGPGIGLGHAMRCIALAEAFRDQSFQPVLLGEGQAELESLAPGLFFPLPAHDRDYFFTDPEGWVRELCCDAYQIFVVDSYRMPLEQLDRYRQAGLYVVYMDDFYSSPIGCNLVINGSLAAEGAEYTFCHDEGIYLAGPHYALLRQQVRTIRTKRIKEKVPLSESPLEANAPVPIAMHQSVKLRVLVTVGGDDVQGHLPSILAGLELFISNCQEINDFRVHVVLGPFMKPPTAAWDRHWIQWHKPPINILDLAASVDMAIIAAGVTLQEMLCIGVPILLVLQADNQLLSAKVAISGGMSISLHPELQAMDWDGSVSRLAPLDPRFIAGQLHRLFAGLEAQRIVQCGMLKMDGLGAARCVSVALEHAKAICR
ncbi:hypothetical protein GJ688_11710 [Heliobacillus mobilis]|uniref:UDP-2,4-diacetamido-2,4, 6-trideoxy-beta-L-altropyranose hydrolase n=1 Tax=Heliobacterium mobile TaxID=28064 RepID=A0A6I3SL23_HELMO|nr:hypothetical protein [Heliobacterium mobile]MTV49641.1 hypothetical protein [Heliobacterium mobile]